MNSLFLLRILFEHLTLNQVTSLLCHYSLPNYDHVQIIASTL